MNPDTLAVHQIVRKTGWKNYKIDRTPDGLPKKKVIDMKDDRAIAEAIRYALTGNL